MIGQMRNEDGTFLKGVSGNLAGRPKGVRDKRLLFTLELFEETNGDIRDLFKLFVKAGLGGNFQAGGKALDFMLVKPTTSLNLNESESEVEDLHANLTIEARKALAAIFEGKKVKICDEQES